MLFIERDAESISIYTGATGPEDLIVRANHDEHGWAGMDLLDDAIEAIADIYNIEVHCV